MRQIVQKDAVQLQAATLETPVDCVLRLFGGARATAIAGLTTDALKKWRRRGGLIPSRYQRLYLEAARADGLPLTAEQLIGGQA